MTNNPTNEPGSAEERPGPPAVNRFEYNLLRVTRFLTGYMPADQGIPIVLKPNPNPPPCLSATCLRLLQDTLGKALIPSLVRIGGWRRDTYLRRGQPIQGRVWERIPTEERALDFSRHTVAFLLWITVEHPIETKKFFNPPTEELGVGDELFFLKALDALRVEPKIVNQIIGFSCFAQNPFCRLVFPTEFAEPKRPLPSFQPLFTAPRVALLECLQPFLGYRYLLSERAKGQAGNWQTLRQIGLEEDAVLKAFLHAAEQANRRDLARFLFKANQGLHTPSEPMLEPWIGGLQGDGPPRLADRLETHRAALAVPRQLLTLQQWERNARAIGYFDDEYQAAQMYKADWEQAQGEQLAARARTIIDSIEPLRTGGPS